MDKPSSGELFLAKFLPIPEAGSKKYPEFVLPAARLESSHNPTTTIFSTMTSKKKTVKPKILNNWVAKYAIRFHKAAVHPDRNTYRRQNKHRNTANE